MITAAESRSTSCHWKLNFRPLGPKDNIVPPPWCFCKKNLLEAMSGVPKATPTFGDLLEGLIELSLYLLLTEIHNPKPIPAVFQQLFMGVCSEVKILSDPLHSFRAKVR